LPIFLALLKDTDSEVRITLFKKLSLITKVLGVESLSQSVIPALTELAQDKNWRIRAQTIEVLAFFAKAIVFYSSVLEGAEFLNDKVIKLLMDWLADRVFAVREAAINSVKQLVEILGSQWAEKNILAKIIGFQTFPNYLQRLTVLFTIAVSHTHTKS
jgi:serine/threonine-protein phosphatase 2A regulatory subunit A